MLKGETLRQAAWRKAREEVSLNCWVGPVVHTAETVFPDGPGGVAVHSVNTVFLLMPKRTPAVYFNSTIEDFWWFNPAKALGDTLALHSYVQECLRKAGFE